MTVSEFEALPLNERENKRIWVCDFYYHRLENGKPTRNLKPTEVRYECPNPTSNDPCGRSFWYKKCIGNFYTIGGDKAVKEINPFANTCEHHSIEIFFSEADCIDRYIELCNKATEALEERKQKEIKSFDGKIAAVQRSLKEWVLHK